MKRFRLSAACFFSAALFLCTSCSGIIGYSVLLWNVPEKEIEDGTVVPVYVKSNISKVYVIGVPGSDEKIEVPLWKLSEPEKKSRAFRRAALYSEYSGMYAACAFDGLPIREESQNASKQVYRLRKNEVIRTLHSGEGIAPATGGVELPGEWLYVLTGDGTKGWCFSYNLRAFKMNPDGTYGAGAESAEVQEKDETLEALLAVPWYYPDYYRPMIARKQIDLESVVPGYGFDTGFASGTVKISLPNVTASFPYGEFIKADSGEYKIEGAPVEVFVRSRDYIVVKYTDSSGKPKSYSFISLGEDEKIEELISSERSRRQRQYKSVQSLGPDFKSGSYGTLSFNDGNMFQWTGFSRLVPGVIPAKARGSGLVEIKYFPDGTLKSAWDGVLTFHFENGDREVNFLYKKEVNGLRMAYAKVYGRTDSVTGRNIPAVSLPANSIVLFFQN